jgi:hypothetical protein
MKMPYVSRATHVRAIDALERRVERADHTVQEMHRLHEADREWERRRYDELLEKYHSLRGAGATLPAPVAESNGIDEAIDQKVRQFGNSTRLRRMLQDFARKESMKATDPDAIAARILDWRTESAEGE